MNVKVKACVLIGFVLGVGAGLMCDQMSDRYALGLGLTVFGCFCLLGGFLRYLDADDARGGHHG